MAIKGKKKSQKRGAQARRRPAAPPRPSAAPAARTPWYRTPLGFVAVLTALALLAGVIIWAVQGAREDARALENRQERLETYTGKIRAILQTLRGPIGEMAAAPAALQEQAQADQLREDAGGWARQLSDVQADAGKIVPPVAMQRAHSLYAQSIQIYLGAASAYKLAADTTAEAQVDAIALGAQQRAQGSAIWTEATGLLDDERIAADLERSGLAAPDAAPQGAPGAQPPGMVPTQPPPGTGPPGGGQPGGQPGEGDGGKKESTGGKGQ